MQGLGSNSGGLNFNPPAVTKDSLGLGNVDNTHDADKPVSTAQQAAIDLKLNISSASSQAEAEEGTENSKYMSALRVWQAVAAWWSGLTVSWSKISKTTSSLADLETRSASDLSSGTLPDGRFPATLPAVSGQNLTGVLKSTALDTDAALAANSDAKIASQKAVKSYVDNRQVAASQISDSTSAGRGLLTAADAAAQRALLATGWAASMLTKNGRTTFSNANYTALSTDWYIAQVGTMSAPRTLTLPAASSVPAGIPITIRDESGTVNRNNYITVARSGSDTIIESRNSGPASATSYVYQNAQIAVRFYSDGVSKWFADDGLALGMLEFQLAANGQPETGIFWGTSGSTADGSNSGSILMDSSAGKAEVRYAFPRQAILTTLFSSSDVGYLQLGNNNWDGAYTFLGSQGTSTANRTTCPSMALVFKTNYWTGSAASYCTPTVRGEMDTSGNPRLSFYATGRVSPTGDINSTWNPNYNGTGNPGRTFDAGTETARLVAGGWDMLGNKIVGLASGVSASPSLTGSTDATTGIGFFGAELQLTRASTVLMRTDATYKVVFNDLLTCLNSVQCAAGSASFPSITRTDNNSVGFFFPASNIVAVTAGGTERQRWLSTGIIWTPPASAPSLATNGTVTFELTNNTTLTFKARGSDGTTRSGTITLS